MHNGYIEIQNVLSSIASLVFCVRVVQAITAYDGLQPPPPPLTMSMSILHKNDRKHTYRFISLLGHVPKIKSISSPDCLVLTSTS
ncbi:hypothetical protein M378DRAFT_194907 [Amanita muscaria Koide BX008]|uniref:Secreted protein n=1 Tax=Amanita muscaria (strain Koide BX008) TaxID=946122 RepID=A0A0C2TTH9_AMAMK|nr:hypothetical protein M378DRAFT_194907 [Amanita muscaria Koide BX008]